MFNIFKISTSELFKRVISAIIPAVIVLVLGPAFLNYTGSRAYGLSYENFVKTVNKYRQIGNPNANVMIIEYSDFQCPWCEKFEEKDLPYIIKNYVKRGEVFIEFRDFPLTTIHPYAFKAAEYADCAALQGKYLKIRSLLYRHQMDWSTAGDLYYFLKAHAGGVINLQQVESCVKSGQAERLIKSNMAAGIRLRLSGTPIFFIYKGLALYKKVIGYRPYSRFNEILKKAVN